MKSFILTIIFSILLSTTTFATLKGNGDFSSPFIIQSLPDFLEFRDTVNHGFYDANAILQTDIDLSSICYKDSLTNQDIQWLPIGEGITIHYKGNFDGNGHVVRNIYVNSDVECYRGIFGSTKNAHIRNLGSENNYIQGGYYTGGIIGIADSTTVTNCYSSGIISGYFTSGIIGCAYNSSIVNCYSVASIQGNYYGCIAGYTSNCNISHCYFNPAYTDRKIGFGDGDVTSLNTNNFKDGTVTKLLNDYVSSYGGDSLLKWNQQIGFDTIPVYKSTVSFSNVKIDKSYLYYIDSDLYLHAEENGTTTIYDIKGNLILRKKHTIGENKIGRFHQGYYFINGKTKFIK